MIVWASAVLMSWEFIAMATHRPTVSDLSHRSPFAYVVWAWMCWLIVHLTGEAVRGR